MAINNIAPEYVSISVTRDDGYVHETTFNTKMSVGSLLPDYAKTNGFILTEDGLFWVREPALELIRALIDLNVKHGKAYEGHAVASWRVVANDAWPPDRIYRDAWKDIGGDKIVHDMDKARAIQMDRIRTARAPELEALDREWMKAMGQKNAVQADAIEAQRQVLRDIPQTLDLSKAATAEELKAIWPAELA